jgi:hypothetical protein
MPEPSLSKPFNRAALPSSAQIAPSRRVEQCARQGVARAAITFKRQRSKQCQKLSSTFHRPDSDAPQYSSTVRAVTMECIMTTKLTPNFDPAYVATLRQVLDLAVEQIAAQHRTPATKAMMAETIVRHAAGGVTDAHALVSHAVIAGANGAP